MLWPSTTTLEIQHRNYLASTRSTPLATLLTLTPPLITLFVLSTIHHSSYQCSQHINHHCSSSCCTIHLDVSHLCLVPHCVVIHAQIEPATPCRCNNGLESGACIAHEQAPAHTTLNTLQQISTPTIQPGKVSEPIFFISIINYQ
jgi:hypothetical protein